MQQADKSIGSDAMTRSFRPGLLIAIVLASAVFLAAARLAAAQGRQTGRSSRPAAEEVANDRLPRALEKRVQELTEAGKPEQVAKLLADKPKMFRIHVARAYAQAGINDADPALRERYFAKAVEEYREVLSLEADADWFRGERRRFDVAQWHVELGDLILRRWIAPDMDRYEITSGLDFNRELLSGRLKEAQASYAAAGRLLDDLAVGVRTEEERYLLLGIAAKIAPLREQQQLNAAWTSLYLAITGDPDAADRNSLLSAALNAFDAVGRKARQADRKYNALLGAGIALYRAKRYSEADAAFDRVIRSTAPLPLAARARLEKARAFMQAGKFAEARNDLDALAAIAESRLQGEDAGATFYVRLAPLIRAYSYLLESRASRGEKSEEVKILKEKAYSGFAKIAEEGGVWPEIVQVYLVAFEGQKRELADLSDLELRMKSERLMADKDYAGAIAALRILLDRGGTPDFLAEAKFNLGVCYFQSQDLSAAGEAFLALAQSRPAGDVGEKATEYAYRCWRQIAQASAKPTDYLRLAESGELLAARFPKHKLADEAGWVAALARQEAGDFEGAMAAYAKTPPNSKRYWGARRNIARCKQAVYDTLPAASSPPRRRRAAEQAAEAWRELANDLDKAVKSGAIKLEKKVATKPSGIALSGFTSVREARECITDARLSAAHCLAGDDLRGYAEALRLLDDLPLGGRVLALRLRCYRGLGDLQTANRVLEEFLSLSTPASAPESGADQSAASGPAEEQLQAEPAAVLAAVLGLAAEMEKETAHLKALNRETDATRTAAEAVETLRQLLDWMEKQPQYTRHVPVVRYGLAKALAQAGRPQEALTQVEQLMADSPEDGEYVCTAARLQEQIGRAGPSASAPAEARSPILDKAEALWLKLLGDPTLRDRAPAVYWEARYHWLEHQLRHGRAAEVLKGIETERAWYPDLGGSPWQAKLLDLAARAEAAVKGQAATRPT